MSSVAADTADGQDDGDTESDESEEGDHFENQFKNLVQRKTCVRNSSTRNENRGKECTL